MSSAFKEKLECFCGNGETISSGTEGNNSVNPNMINSVKCREFIEYAREGLPYFKRTQQRSIKLTSKMAVHCVCLFFHSIMKALKKREYRLVGLSHTIHELILALLGQTHHHSLMSSMSVYYDVVIFRVWR